MTESAIASFTRILVNLYWYICMGKAVFIIFQYYANLKQPMRIHTLRYGDNKGHQCCFLTKFFSYIPFNKLVWKVKLNFWLNICLGAHTCLPNFMEMELDYFPYELIFWETDYLNKLCLYFLWSSGIWHTISKDLKKVTGHL